MKILKFIFGDDNEEKIKNGVKPVQKKYKLPDPPRKRELPKRKMVMTDRVPHLKFEKKDLARPGNGRPKAPVSDIRDKVRASSFEHDESVPVQTAKPVAEDPLPLQDEQSTPSAPVEDFTSPSEKAPEASFVVKTAVDETLQSQFDEFIRSLSELTEIPVTAAALTDRNDPAVKALFGRRQKEIIGLQSMINKFFNFAGNILDMPLKEYALFHIDDQTLVLIFNKNFIISVLTPSADINDGVALAVLRPAAREFLSGIVA